MQSASALAILTLSILTACDPSASTSPAADPQRHIRYGFVVENTSRTPLTGVEVSVAAPSETSGQRISALSASRAFDLAQALDGERRLRFRLDLAPFGTEVIEVDATVGWSAAPSTIHDDARPAGYTAPGRWIESDAPAVKAAALGLPDGGDPHELAASASSLVGSRLSATSFEAEPKGAVAALESGRGDCTEFAHLVVALLRARRVPSRVVTGFALEGDARPRPEELHDWAEYFADGRWHVVDAQRQVLRPPAGRYLALRVSPPAADGQVEDAAGAALVRAPPGVGVRLN